MCETKNIQEIIYDIHKRKNEYLFGNSINNVKCSYENEDCQGCSYSIPDGCPFYSRGSNKINPLRFVQCYVSKNKGFLKFLDDNDFIVAAPLFRIHQIKNGEIDYLDHYWYPFRNGAFVDLPIRTSNLNLSIQIEENRNQSFEKLRWDITTQRNSKKYEKNLGFSLFKKIQETDYSKDKDFKYIDVCDGYATFMMLYFIIVKRREALDWEYKKEKKAIIKDHKQGISEFEANDGKETFINNLIKKKYKNKFEDSIEWELTELNDILRDYIGNSSENILRLSIKEKTINNTPKQIVYRKSTWKEDLQLLGLMDYDGKFTIKLDWFITWLYKNDDFSDKKIIPYKKLLKQLIPEIDKELKLNYEELAKDVIFLAKNPEKIKFQFKDNEKKDFTLSPPMHIIVRAFWLTPVRWFFIPMTPVFKEKSKKTLSTSGMILMLKDDKETTAYKPGTKEHKIITKVKTLLPLLTSIYAIEKQSLEDHINEERIRLHSEQKTTAIRSAIAKVFLRTLTHNIGSHVINKISEPENLELEPLLELAEKNQHSNAVKNEQYRGLFVNCKRKTQTIYNIIESEVKTSNNV